MTDDSHQPMSPLRWVRKHVFGLKQEDFSKLAGVSRPAVSRYETGTDNPPFLVLGRIRRAAVEQGLRFSGDWFFEVPNVEGEDAGGDQ